MSPEAEVQQVQEWEWGLLGWLSGEPFPLDLSLGGCGFVLCGSRSWGGVEAEPFHAVSYTWFSGTDALGRALVVDANGGCQ